LFKTIVVITVTMSNVTTAQMGNSGIADESEGLIEGVIGGFTLGEADNDAEVVGICEEVDDMIGCDSEALGIGVLKSLMFWDRGAAVGAIVTIGVGVGAAVAVGIGVGGGFMTRIV
jgi:hypothetical protein